MVFFKVYFIDYAITVVPFFSPLYSAPLCTPPLSSISPLRSYPWVVHTSFLGFSISHTILNLPWLFCTYHFCFLFPVPFPSLPSPLLTNNPPCDIHFCDSVPVLVVCLVMFSCVKVLHFTVWSNCDLFWCMA